MSFGKCPSCGANLQIDTKEESTFGERFCPKCGLVVDIDVADLSSNPDLRRSTHTKLKEEMERDIRLPGPEHLGTEDVPFRRILLGTERVFVKPKRELCENDKHFAVCQLLYKKRKTFHQVFQELRGYRGNDINFVLYDDMISYLTNPEEFWKNKPS